MGNNDVDVEEFDYPDSIGRRLVFAVSAVNSVTAELLREHDLTPLQWVTLCALWRHDGITVTGLADYIRSSVSATSRLLGRLEARQLVERRASADNRRNLEVWLTENAMQLRSLSNLYEVVNELVLGDLTDKERVTFVRCLEKITETSSREAERLRGLREV